MATISAYTKYSVFSFPLYMRIQAILGFLLLWAFSVQAQQGQGIIEGRVLDEYGQALEFVSVSVRDLPQGARTNA